MADLTNLLNAAPVRPTLTGTGVSNVVKLHEEIAAFEVAEAKRTADIAKARETGLQISEWLLRQGAVLNKDGTVKRDQSHSIVKYDHQLAEQGMTKVRFDAGGQLYWDDALRQPVDTRQMVTHFSGPGYAIYVLSGEGNLHIASHSIGQYPP